MNIIENQLFNYIKSNNFKGFNNDSVNYFNAYILNLNNTQNLFFSKNKNYIDFLNIYKVPKIFLDLLNCTEKYKKKWLNKSFDFKTLIGKNNYLFLNNDNNNGLLKNINNNKINIRNKNLKNYFLVIYPDKEIIQKKFLPNFIKINQIKNTNNYFYPINLLDDTDYYKTDTHINLKGNIKVFLKFIDLINNKFKLNLKIPNFSINHQKNIFLRDMKFGLGDLTWDNNIEQIYLPKNINDDYYSFKDFPNLYMNRISNIKNFKLQFLDNNLNVINEDNMNWGNISKYLLHSKNKNIEDNKTILVFFDSFLLSLLPLFIRVFDNIYFSKTKYNKKIVTKIKPDFIFEFSVQRFNH